MTKIDPLQASFNAGELSPRLHARTDFVKYPSGLEECQNLIPLPEGGLTRRPATRFVAEVVDSTKKGRLFDFEATAEQHHVLELGENKIRFYFRQGQQVVLDTDAVITNGLFPSNITDWDDRSTGGAGNQISHDASNGRLTLETSGTAADDIGWAEQDITTTDTDQETVIKFEVIGDPGDKIEFQVGTTSTGSETLGPVEKAVGFHCVAFTPTTSPFYVQFRNLGSNADKDVQIDNVSIIDDSALEIDSPYIEAQLSQITGSQSNDLKYLFRSGVAPYKLERRALASWSLVRVAWQDGPYIPQNSTATTLTPAATSGVAVAVTASSTSGINGGQGFLSTDVGRLIRIDNGAAWGWGIIVGLTSTTIVDVHVKKAFATTNATADWRLGAWSDTTGWPKTSGFFEQRLYVASTDFQSQTLWGSQTADFENFKPDDDNGVVEDDDALNFTLSADSVNEIRWLSAGQDTLAIGTAGGEWVPSASGIVITPLDITIRRQTTYGSALVAPLRVGSVVLFVQKARRKIREFVFNFESDSFLAPDITRLAQHITASGIGEMAFQQEPDSIVWVARSDGVMLSLTFRRDEDVVGWSRHNIGGRGTNAASVSFNITGGSNSPGVNQITSITIDGVEILGSPIDWVGSNEETATFIVDYLARTGDVDLDNIIDNSISFSADDSQFAGGFSSYIAFKLDGTKMYLMTDITGAGNAKFYQYDLSTAWDVSTAVLVDVGGEVVSVVERDLPQGIGFSSDGTKMFTIDNTLNGVPFGNALYQYDLSIPWDLSTLTDNNIPPTTGGSAAPSSAGLDLNSEMTTSYDFKFSIDGTHVYVIGAGHHMFQYDMTVPYNIKGAQYSGNTIEFDNPSVGSIDGVNIRIAFSPDGKVLLGLAQVGSNDGNHLLQYNLSTAWDLSTAVYTEKRFLVSPPIGAGKGRGVVLSNDGSNLYLIDISGSSFDIIHQFSFPDTQYTSIGIGSIITITGASDTTQNNDKEVVVTTIGDVEIDGTVGGVSTFTMASTGIPLSESVVTISGNDGAGQVQNSEDRDEVWTMVKRTINGETKRYVEFFEGYYDNLLHDQEDAYYADSIITYDGVSTDTITGLSHLEGETVKVWGDGAILPDVVVSNGQVVLATAVKVAQIGLAYTHRLKTLKIEGGNPAGTAMGKKKSINGITFVLQNSHTLTFGPNDDNLFETDFRLVSDPMDAGAPLFTGEQFRGFDGGLATDTRIIVESDDPAPFTLLAMIPEVKVNPSK